MTSSNNLQHKIPRNAEVNEVTISAENHVLKSSLCIGYEVMGNLDSSVLTERRLAVILQGSSGDRCEGEQARIAP